MKQIILFLLTMLAFPAFAQKAEGVMTGTTATIQFTKNTIAVLKNGTDGLGFYPITSTTSVKANTAYLPENKQLLIDLSTLDGPLTGIALPRYPSEGDEIVNRKSLNGKCYDLSGREMSKGRSAQGDASRLKKLPRGIYVTNKQKFAVKP